MGNIKDCWKAIKSFKSTNLSKSYISANEWSVYFKTLLNELNNVNKKHYDNVTLYLEKHDQHCELCESAALNDLNRDFVYEEIVKAINDLPRGKSPGPDGLIAEFFKQSIDIFAPILTTLCNTILESQNYTDQWATALLLPVSKKGAPSDPANYRGISLLPIMSKIFTKCVSTRMLKWAENNRHICCRGGFRVLGSLYVTSYVGSSFPFNIRDDMTTMYTTYGLFTDDLTMKYIQMIVW